MEALEADLYVPDELIEEESNMSFHHTKLTMEYAQASISVVAPQALPKPTAPLSVLATAAGEKSSGRSRAISHDSVLTEAGLSSQAKPPSSLPPTPVAEYPKRAPTRRRTPLRLVCREVELQKLHKLDISNQSFQAMLWMEFVIPKGALDDNLTAGMSDRPPTQHFPVDGTTGKPTFKPSATWYAHTRVYGAPLPALLTLMPHAVTQRDDAARCSCTM